MITFDQSPGNLLSILGAIFDIAGAVVLARALVFVRANQILQQGRTGTWGLNPRFVRIFAEQRVDGAVGLFLLFLGFCIQGAAGYGVQSTSWSLFALAMAALIIMLVAYWFLRTPLTKRGFVQACRLHGGELTDDKIEAWWSALHSR